MTRPHLLLLTSLSCCSALTPLLAQERILVQDDFEAAPVTEDAVSVDSKATWILARNRSGLAIGPDAEGLNSGKALAVPKGLVYVEFPEVSLAVGESLILKLRFHYLGGELEEVAFPLRIGLANSGQEEVGAGMFPGYWFMTNPANEENKAMLVVEQGTDGSTGGGTDIATAQPPYTAVYNKGGSNTLTFTITRSSEINTELSAQINDEAPEVRDDETGLLSKFNVMAISNVRIEPEFVLVDDVSVTTTAK